MALSETIASVTGLAELTVSPVHPLNNHPMAGVAVILTCLPRLKIPPVGEVYPWPVTLVVSVNCGIESHSPHRKA